MAEETGETPKALLNQPDLPEHLQYALTAFWDLTTDRQLGAMGGCGPIPWTAIERYATRHAILELDEFERFVRLIRALDQAYMAHVAKKNKAGG